MELEFYTIYDLLALVFAWISSNKIYLPFFPEATKESVFKF